MPSAVIAEDEKLLREELVSLLSRAWPGLDLVAVAEDGAQALEALDRHQPDVAFLDIRMPGLTGLDVAGAAATVSPGTHVVFVTAYDQYAIEAFERGAVDYLLKPVTPERLAATCARVKSRLAAGPTDAAVLADLLQKLRSHVETPKREPLQWITATTGRETRLILVEDVAYFHADDKYTVVMTAEGESLIRKPIRDLLEVLDPAVFKQVHRSTIVNLKAVASVVRDEAGRGTLKLRNRPETLAVSIPYMPVFRNL